MGSRSWTISAVLSKLKQGRCWNGCLRIHSGLWPVNQTSLCGNTGAPRAPSALHLSVRTLQKQPPPSSVTIFTLNIHPASTIYLPGLILLLLEYVESPSSSNYSNPMNSRSAHLEHPFFKFNTSRQYWTSLSLWELWVDHMNNNISFPSASGRE